MPSGMGDLSDAGSLGPWMTVWSRVASSPHYFGPFWHSVIMLSHWDLYMFVIAVSISWLIKSPFLMATSSTCWQWLLCVNSVNYNFCNINIYVCECSSLISDLKVYLSHPPPNFGNMTLIFALGEYSFSNLSWCASGKGDFSPWVLPGWSTWPGLSQWGLCILLATVIGAGVGAWPKLV